MEYNPAGQDVAVEKDTDKNHQIYRDNDEPYYHTGNAVLIALAAWSFIMFIVAKLYYIWRNQYVSFTFLHPLFTSLHILTTCPQEQCQEMGRPFHPGKGRVSGCEPVQREQTVCLFLAARIYMQ